MLSRSSTTSTAPSGDAASDARGSVTPVEFGASPAEPTRPAPAKDAASLARLDAAVRLRLARVAPLALRLSLGIVFLWFGALKVLGVSPVEQLVGATVGWIRSSWLVPALGVVEVGIGLGLISARLLRPVLVLFAVQMAGTFLVLVVLPGVAFQDHNLLMLTTEGEFVVKNLVLISAGLTLASWLHPLGERSRRGARPSPG